MTDTDNRLEPESTAVLIVDLQNDFLDPAGAYGRAGQTSPEIAALPDRLLPLLDAVRKAGGWIVSTQFTLLPGKGGEPFISAHLKNYVLFSVKVILLQHHGATVLLTSYSLQIFMLKKLLILLFTRREWNLCCLVPV